MFATRQRSTWQSHWFMVVFVLGYASALYDAYETCRSRRDHLIEPVYACDRVKRYEAGEPAGLFWPLTRSIDDYREECVSYHAKRERSCLPNPMSTFTSYFISPLTSLIGNGLGAFETFSYVTQFALYACIPNMLLAVVHVVASLFSSVARGRRCADSDFHDINGGGVPPIQYRYYPEWDSEPLDRPLLLRAPAASRVRVAEKLD